MNRSYLRVVIAIALLTLRTSNGAEDKPSTEDSDTRAASPLRTLLNDSLSWTELFSDESSKTPMTTKVVMRWANNTRGSEEGMTVLAISNGRPEAAFCVYPWEKNLVQEFDSLSRKTLIAKRDGQVVWRPEKPGVSFEAVPEAEVPASNAPSRLRQMKAIASQFNSTMLGWRSDKTDREELRLLPQPLYRYETLQDDYLDGAVFAFVQGTDPESLLILEAVKSQERYEWQFAFARRTSGELEARFKDKIVWHADRYPPNDNIRATHRALIRQMDASLPVELQKKRAAP